VIDYVDENPTQIFTLGDWVVQQQLYGPVIIDTKSPFSLGATVGSLNFQPVS